MAYCCYSYLLALSIAVQDRQDLSSSRVGLWRASTHAHVAVLVDLTRENSFLSSIQLKCISNFPECSRTARNRPKDTVLIYRSAAMKERLSRTTYSTDSRSLKIIWIEIGKMQFSQMSPCFLRQTMGQYEF
ncbi:hypothetical protein ANN_24777 [Periplaneta americana]|uniref:Uncharacterized protein n=1 Tax=Periplaneta americana TaxID=6978 RepID=A0ABQ8S071_PERAM|nr:hypothetical protein ANN_24777 [Periplaneta americana]